MSSRLTVLAALLGAICAACEGPGASTGTQPEAPPRTLADYVGRALPPVSAARVPWLVASGVATTTGSATLTFFSDRAAFNAQAAGLPQQDFQAGNVAAFSLVVCPGPLDSNSNNACFAPGAILPGVRFNSSQPENGSELALVGTGFLGAPSKVLVANHFTDAFVTDFTAGSVTAVGADLVAYPSADQCAIDILGANGLLGSTTAPCTNGGSFWGVISDQPITEIRQSSPTHKAAGVANVAFGATAAAVINVAVEIKPGSTVHPMNPWSQGVIPVAVLSTPTFDASRIDVSTVAFGPNGAQAIGGGQLEDVNGDGLLDLVLHFATQATGISCGDTQATLTGRTVSGQQFSGSAAVTTVGCRGGHSAAAPR